MKNTLIVLFIVIAGALGALCVHQRSQLIETRNQLATVQNKLQATEDQLAAQAEASEKIALAEQKAKLLQKTLSETSAQAAKQFEQVNQLQQSLASAKTNNAGDGLAGLFKDPEMKKMIKEQQKSFMGPMIDKSYAALFQQLNLTPEQTAYVKDVLQKKMLVASDMGMSMLDGGADASKRADLARQVKTETDAYDEQIKQFLGDENYKSFQSYEKSIPDRLVVGQFRDQIAGSGTSLAAAQEQQLIQAMSEQRANFKWTTDYSNQQNSENTDYTAMFNEDRLATYAQEKEQFDQQFLQRARQILTPEQLTAFENFQTSQRNMQVAAMKMAAKMFAPKSQ